MGAFRVFCSAKQVPAVEGSRLCDLLSGEAMGEYGRNASALLENI